MHGEEDKTSRRRFLKQAGGAALATAGIEAILEQYSAEVSAQEGPRSERKIRIGVVGGGFGCSFHWHEDPNCIVEAVSDLRPDRRKRLMKIYKCEKSYESLEKLILDKNIDAVAVFTGAPDHVRHCVAVMNAGKHCISAVPAGISIEECRQLVDTKERTGLKYMMAETSYYRAPAILARKLYADGKFGTLVYTEGEYYHDHICLEKSPLSHWNGKRTWRYGYPPMLYPTHSTSFYVGTTRKRLTEVSCVGWGDDDPALKDNAYGNPFADESALFHTSEGTPFRCNVFWKVYAGGERAQWFGTDLSMYMSSSGGQPFVIRARGQSNVTRLPNFHHMLPETMRRDSGHGGSHPFLTHEFIRALVEDREPAVDVYESVAMTAPGIVAHQSALKGGEQLKIPSFDKA